MKVVVAIFNDEANLEGHMQVIKVCFYYKATQKMPTIKLSKKSIFRFSNPYSKRMPNFGLNNSFVWVSLKRSSSWLRPNLPPQPICLTQLPWLQSPLTPLKLQQTSFLKNQWMCLQLFLRHLQFYHNGQPHQLHRLVCCRIQKVSHRNRQV